MELSLADQRLLIASLRDQAPFPQTCDAVEVIETHISWVLLCGDFAYKIKKALDLGFLDSSTLAKRRQYCFEELRLNRRLAADLYLDVVSIGGEPSQPSLATDSAPIEYAVKMARFEQDELMDHMLRQGQLGDAHMDRLAARVARFHLHQSDTPPAPELGQADAVHEPVRDNFRTLRQQLDDKHLLLDIERIEAWSEQSFTALRDELSRRRADGFVRECHGDMHLGNMAVHNGEIVIFDGIEFNPSLYWIDVMSEVAFVFMDLDDHGHGELAWRFLNRYLSDTGDYAGLRVLRYYLCYRAMVRAKVAAIKARQSQADNPAVAGYIALARRYTCPSRPLLAITHGVSGSGKSTVCEPLSQRFGAVHVRSDRERQRLFGRGGGSGVDVGSYAPDATEHTYARLQACATGALSARFPVLVDATFLDPSQRARFAALADELDAEFRILHFHADAERLRARVQTRQHQGQDLSEADLAVLEHQLRAYQPLQPHERDAVLDIDSEAADVEALAQTLAASLTSKV